MAPWAEKFEHRSLKLRKSLNRFMFSHKIFCTSPNALKCHSWGEAVCLNLQKCSVTVQWTEMWSLLTWAELMIGGKKLTWCPETDVFANKKGPDPRTYRYKYISLHPSPSSFFFCVKPYIHSKQPKSNFTGQREHPDVRAPLAPHIFDYVCCGLVSLISAGNKHQFFRDTQSTCPEAGTRLAPVKVLGNGPLQAGVETHAPALWNYPEVPGVETAIKMIKIQLSVSHRTCK